MDTRQLRLPPRIIIDAICLRLPDGSHLVHSHALQGHYELRATATAATEGLRRYAEERAGEPVRVLATVVAVEREAEERAEA